MNNIINIRFTTCQQHQPRPTGPGTGNRMELS